MSPSAAQRAIDGAEVVTPITQDETPVPRLKAFGLADFLDLEIPEREFVVEPIIPAQGLAMLFAPRGVGKTHVALGIAYAAACGSSFLRWKAPKSRRVLLIDGEMPARAMQERLAAIVKANSDEPADPDNFRIITPDLQDGIMPDIGTPEGQHDLEPWLDGVDLVILDNLSTLSGVKEGEADDWLRVQRWLLDLRRRGHSVLLIHHAGKNGSQRGTSRREDVLDTVLNLKRPDDYSTDDGARFHVHYEKARGFFGDDAKPFEAKLVTVDDELTWATADLQEVDMQRVIDLSNEGMTTREIADETGFSKSRVNRLQQKAREGGLLS